MWLTRVTTYDPDFVRTTSYRLELPSGVHADDRYKDAQSTRVYVAPSHIFKLIKALLPLGATNHWTTLDDINDSLETLCDWSCETRSFTQMEYRVVVETVQTGAIRSTFGIAILYDENLVRIPRKYIRGYIQSTEAVYLSTDKTGKQRRKEVGDMVRKMSLGTRSLPTRFIILIDYSFHLAEQIARRLSEALVISRVETGELISSDISDDESCVVASGCSHGVVKIRVRKCIPAVHRPTCDRMVCVGKARALHNTYQAARRIKLIPRPRKGDFHSLPPPTVRKTVKPPGKHSTLQQLRFARSTDHRKEMERQKKNLDSRFPRREFDIDADNISLPDPITGKYGDLEYRKENEDSTAPPFLNLKQEYVEFDDNSPTYNVKEEGECSDSE
jgi:hypothetical protein